MLVIALRRHPKATPTFGLQSHLAHQAGDALFAHTLTICPQLSMNPQIAIGLATVFMHLTDAA
jgi:hypothetical protein